MEPCCRICLLQRHSGSQLLHRCQIGEDSEDEVDITTDSENEVDDTTGVENDVDVPTALMTSSTLAHVTSPSLAVGGGTTTVLLARDRAAQSHSTNSTRSCFGSPTMSSIASTTLAAFGFLVQAQESNSLLVSHKE